MVALKLALSWIPLTSTAVTIAVMMIAGRLTTPLVATNDPVAAS